MQFGAESVLSSIGRDLCFREDTLDYDKIKMPPYRGELENERVVRGRLATRR